MKELRIFEFEFHDSNLMYGEVRMEYLIAYIFIINIISFSVMYYDKKRSIRHKWRVPESRLFLFACILGSLGMWVGMYIFKHKTKHRRFVFGVPIILIIQLIIMFMLFFYKNS
jgi:uncharacterized membrane protein YsdA (DUF1294 family)